MTSTSNDHPLLSVSGLSVDFRREGIYHNAVRNVSFDVWRGRTLGIVGESGSGKSVSCLSLMRLLEMPPARISSGSAIFRGGQDDIDLLALPDEEMRRLRGSHISMIFQEPMTSLNPVQRCGAQVMEMLQLHERIENDEARKRIIELFDEVQLPRPEKIFDSYPHEISGGQKQRVMIAMALVCHPDIIIADEPTTALDVMVQKTILDLLRQLQQRYNLGIIFITHDLGVIAQIADDVAVMYHGEIVEQGRVKEILMHPQHPYTQGLMACRPPLDSKPHRLPTVHDFMEHQDDHAPLTEGKPQDESTPKNEVLMSVHDLHVDYTLKRDFWGKPRQVLHAVDGVSFDIMRGETLGLVGGSGCGKTTLGRTLLRLIQSASGTITYNGRSLDQFSDNEMRHLRTQLQIIFQDPYSSLNPRITIGDSIAEPLKVHGLIKSNAERRDRVVELMEQVGLKAEHYSRFPHEFSGGQRQRVCIARALVMNPQLVVCDESVSALDVSVQAQVLNLLNELKERYHYTYLFITHDLAVVHYMSDRIIVMQDGKIVESGTPENIFNNPQHPYTQQLIDAIPVIGKREI